jgi:hypothetical protein
MAGIPDSDTLRLMSHANSECWAERKYGEERVVASPKDRTVNSSIWQFVVLAGHLVPVHALFHSVLGVTPLSLRSQRRGRVA